MNRILFNNYDGYDFNAIKSMIMECNNLDEVADEVVWGMIRDMEEEDWSFAMSSLKNAFAGCKVIALGSAGTWRGNFSASSMFDNVEDAISAITKDCMYCRIEIDRYGYIQITGSHHDGTNHFNIKAVTAKGEDVYQDWNYGSKYEDLKEYKILEKIWNNSKYSQCRGKEVK